MTNADYEKERLWEQIKPEIKTDGLYYEYNREVLARAISDLPESDPGRDLWELMKENIEEYEVGITTRRLSIYMSGVAAVIVLFVVTFILYQFISQEQTHELTEINSEEPVESFLSRVCSINPPRCNEAGFIELKSEILNLYSTKIEVANSMFANPEDEGITKVNERINSQIDILKSQIIEYVE
jgi:hypothetical protein